MQVLFDPLFISQTTKNKKWKDYAIIYGRIHTSHLFIVKTLWSFASAMQVSGEHQLCRDVHKLVQGPLPEVHPGFTRHACLHGSKYESYSITLGQPFKIAYHIDQTIVFPRILVLAMGGQVGHIDSRLHHLLRTVDAPSLKEEKGGGGMGDCTMFPWVEVHRATI